MYLVNILGEGQHLKGSVRRQKVSEYQYDGETKSQKKPTIN